MSDHQAIEDLLGAYALDALDAEELEAVERHLPDCPRCAAEVRDHRAVAGLIGSVGEAPPEGLWPRIASSLEDRPPTAVPFPLERSRARDDRRRWMLTGGLGLAAALVVGLLTWQVIEQQDQIDALDEDVALGAGEQSVAAVVSEPGSDLMTLESDDGDQIARAVVSEQGEGYLLGEPLPELPAGETYQLWAVTDAETISLGVLGPEPGIATFHVGSPPDQLALTAEPGGGSVSPQGPLVAEAQFA